MIYNSNKYLGEPGPFREIIPCSLCGEVPAFRRKGKPLGYCAPCRKIRRKESLNKWQQSPQGRYRGQMDGAIARGIPWEFTLETWVAWWGEDFSRRGTCGPDLCMARNGDTGPYAPWNCHKATTSENTQEQLKLRWHGEEA